MLKLKNSNVFTIFAASRIWYKLNNVTVLGCHTACTMTNMAAFWHSLLTLINTTLFWQFLWPTWQCFNSHWFHTEFTLSDNTVCWHSCLPQYASSFQGRYLNFGAWFTKNVLFEQKKIKLWTKWHSGKIKQRLCTTSKKSVNFLVA